jgi:hypothetical protein
MNLELLRFAVLQCSSSRDHHLPRIVSFRHICDAQDSGENGSCSGPLL